MCSSSPEATLCIIRDAAVDSIWNVKLKMFLAKFEIAILYAKFTCFINNYIKIVLYFAQKMKMYILIFYEMRQCGISFPCGMAYAADQWPFRSFGIIFWFKNYAVIVMCICAVKAYFNNIQTFAVLASYVTSCFLSGAHV